MVFTYWNSICSPFTHWQAHSQCGFKGGCFLSPCSIKNTCQCHIYSGTSFWIEAIRKGFACAPLSHFVELLLCAFYPSPIPQTILPQHTLIAGFWKMRLLLVPRDYTAKSDAKEKSELNYFYCFCSKNITSLLPNVCRKYVAWYLYNRCKSNSGRAINPRCECILMYLELLQLESSTPIEDPELIILGRVRKLVYQREFVILSLLTIGLGDVPSSMVYAILFYKSVAKMSNKLFCSSPWNKATDSLGDLSAAQQSKQMYLESCPAIKLLCYQTPETGTDCSWIRQLA